MVIAVADPIPPNIEIVARDAGLDVALRDFPEDILMAAKAAEHARTTLPKVVDSSQQPWPPIAMRSMR